MVALGVIASFGHSRHPCRRHGGASRGNVADAYFDNLDLQLQSPQVAISRRFAAKRHVTLTARTPAGLKTSSVTFRLAGRSRVDRMAPFVLRSKSAVATGGRTPITKAVTLPMAHPTTCVVIASATLASSNKMTVTILAR